MRHPNLFVLLLSALCFVACENTSRNASEEISEDSVVTCETEKDSVVTCKSMKDSLLATIDEEKHLESLVFWAPDTACVMNPELSFC